MYHWPFCPYNFDSLLSVILFERIFNAGKTDEPGATATGTDAHLKFEVRSLDADGSNHYNSRGVRNYCI